MAEVQELQLNDLGDVLNETLCSNKEWYNIGLRLKVPVAKLDSIGSEFSKPEKCLREVEKEWLKGAAETRPTWEVLVEALRNHMVGEPQLACQLEAKHCQSGRRSQSSPSPPSPWPPTLQHAVHRKMSSPPLHYTQEACSVSGKSIKILVTGQVGQGKSKLVNTLIGKVVAKEGVGPRSVTRNIESFTEDINGVQVTIVDTPGLSDLHKSDQETITSIANEIDEEPIHLILFCVRMDRRMEKDDYRIMRKLTWMFEQSIWEHVVFVLTFANKIDQNTFAKTQVEWEEDLRKYAHTKGEVPTNIAKQIPVVVAGNEEKSLPGYESWLAQFWEIAYKQTKYNTRSAYFSLTLRRNNIDFSNSCDESLESLMNIGHCQMSTSPLSEVMSQKRPKRLPSATPPHPTPAPHNGATPPHPTPAPHNGATPPHPTPAPHNGATPPHPTPAPHNGATPHDPTPAPDTPCPPISVPETQTTIHRPTSSPDTGATPRRPTSTPDTDPTPSPDTHATPHHPTPSPDTHATPHHPTSTPDAGDCFCLEMEMLKALIVILIYLFSRC